MKRKFIVIALLLIASFASVQTFAKTDKHAIEQKVAAMTQEQKEARAEEIKARVIEIQCMDKSMLSSADKRELRHELRDMNKEAKSLGNGGIYISLAGIVIAILVLILILR